MPQVKRILVYVDTDRNNSAMRHDQLAEQNETGCRRGGKKKKPLLSREVILLFFDRTAAMILRSSGKTPSLIAPARRVKQNIDRLITGPVSLTGIHGFPGGNPAGQILKSVIRSLPAVKPDGFVFPIQIK